MSQERSERVESGILVRVLRSSLLIAALVCATALPPAGRAFAPRPDAGLVGAAPSISAGIIAYEAGGEIYVIDAGGTPTKIVESKGGVVNMQPALSPDATRVAFSSNRGGQFSIYLVGVDGQGMRRLTGGGADSEPAWSPDGTRLAFVRGFDATGSGVVIMTCQTPGDILVVNAEEDASVQQPVETNLTNGQGGTDPAWSPDGTRIAFASDRAGNGYDIYTMSSGNGHDVHRLTKDDSSEADPAWSPDGNWIVYTGKLQEDWRTQCGNMPIIGNPTGTGDDCEKDNTCDDEDSFTPPGGPYIYRMKADGSEQKNLTDTGGAAEPVWSPDGSQVIFVGGSKGDNVDLYLIAWDGTGSWIQLTSDNVEEASPSCAATIIR